MSPHDGRAAWDAQRAVLRALIFDGGLDRSLTAGPTFLVRTELRQVERTAARLGSDVLTRHRRGAVPLTESFSGSLAGVPLEAHPMLAARFRRSSWFAGHGEVPDRRDQLSAEEAFYRFLCDEKIGSADRRLAEFAEAMISALAVQPCAAFRVPPEIERAGFGYFVVIEAAGRTLLFATAHERIVRGPIDWMTAEVLRHRGNRPRGSKISGSVWGAVNERLASIGLAFTTADPAAPGGDPASWFP